MTKALTSMSRNYQVPLLLLIRLMSFSHAPTGVINKITTIYKRWFHNTNVSYYIVFDNTLILLISIEMDCDTD